MGFNPDQVLRLTDIFRIADWQDKLPWKPFRKGVEIYRLYGNSEVGPMAALLRYRSGGVASMHEHTGYEHILVLSGAQVDENSRAEAGTFIVNPPGTRHSVYSETGCIVLAIYEKPVRFIAEQKESSETQDVSHAGPSGSVLLAVNGTLMRGLELNSNLLDEHAIFIKETTTAPVYRLWSIDDRHPAMVRVKSGGSAVAVEIWAVPPAGLASILLKEPPGLSIGKVELLGGIHALGVLGEPALCQGQKEITEFGGWRAYASKLRDDSRS